MNEVTPESHIEIDDNLIKDYLFSHPEFFEKYPHLLESLRIPHGQKGAVSLVEKQTNHLRYKVAALQEEITALMSVANRNEKIYRVFVDIYIKLVECQSIEAIETLLKSTLLRELNLASLVIKLFDQQQQNSATVGFSEKALLDSKLKKDGFYFGRLNQQEKDWLFGQLCADSVALMTIGSDKPIGLVAVGSENEHHFYPEMDTLLITQLQRLLTIKIEMIKSGDAD